MIVDDEEDVRQLGLEILGGNGFDVVTAANGKLAIDRLDESGDVDLVVLDMIMPVMGGRETCVELKKRARPSKVLISTGYSQLSDLEDVLENYADGLLQKPYTTGELLEAVNKLI